MIHCVFVVALLASFTNLSLGQVAERAKPIHPTTDDSPSQQLAVTSEGSAIKLADADAAEEVIKNRANGLPTITHTRIFDLGHIREINGREATLERQAAKFDPTAATMTIDGTMYGRKAIEDVRLLEHDGTLHILRDIYVEPDEQTLFSGRNLPAQLTGDGGDAEPRVEKIAAYHLTTAAIATPSITALGGQTSTSAGISNGRVQISCGTTWNGSMVVNDQDNAYTWTITGANFGTTPGMATLGGRSARIVTWTTSQILAAFTVPYNWGPLSTILTIKTAAGASATTGVGIAPAIRTRIYGQCTWYVALTRLNMGKQPSPYAYSGYSSINAAYVPQVGDQYQWNSAHTAIVLAVSSPVLTTGGYKTWTLTIGEYNSKCTNAYNSYTTPFQVRTTTSSTTVTKYPQSSVLSFGSTTLYYR